MLWNSEKNQVPGIAMALFVIFGAAGLGLTTMLGNRLPLIVGLLAGVYLLFSIKVADQCEKVAVLRLGRFVGLRGPGWFELSQRVNSRSVTRKSASACMQK